SSWPHGWSTTGNRGPPIRTGPSTTRASRTSVDVVAPVVWYGALRAGSGLISGMALRVGECRPLEPLLALEVPEPCLAGLEAGDHRMARLAPVRRGVLHR